jgi:hypothetical protein
MARSRARSFQVLRHVLTSSRSAAILFVFIFWGVSCPFFLSRFACFVALRYAVGYPKFRRVRGICHVASSIMPRACLFSGATLHPLFRPVRMSPPPSCPEIASLVELRCTPCFDRLGGFSMSAPPSCPQLACFKALYYTTLHYTPPPVSTGSGICPFIMP